MSTRATSSSRRPRARATSSRSLRSACSGWRSRRNDRGAFFLKVLFVCTGNICRSPTAAGVFAHFVREAGLEDSIQVESAGTHDYHAGEAPDKRAQGHARLRGYDLSALRARQVRKRDFENFDLIVAMDGGHLKILEDNCPPQHQGKLRLLLKGRDVPDPYYGGPEGFEKVLDMVEAACLAMLDEIRETMRAPRRA